MRKALLGVLMLLVCGCAMPETTIKTVDDRPSLVIKGAPEGALLFVDGLNMGSAQEYNGEPKVLNVEPGTHSLRITLNGSLIYEQRIFVESALKTITVR